MFYGRKRIYFFIVTFLSLSRLFLSFGFVTLLYKDDSKLYEQLLCFLIIGLSDLLDGKLARQWKVQSIWGAVTDVFCDFIFIISSCFAFYYKNELPFWMIAVILLKMSEFIVTSYILKRGRDHASFFLFDPIGRAVAVGFYILPLFILLTEALFVGSSALLIRRFFFLILGVSGLISSTKRIGFCVSEYRKYKQRLDYKC